MAPEPHITNQNAADYPPPSLNSYRTAASRAPSSAPAIWFKQMTGSAWDCQAKSFDREKKRWRRMADDEYKAKEKARLAERWAERDAAREAKVKEQRRSDEILNRRDDVFLSLLNKRAGLAPKGTRTSVWCGVEHSDLADWEEGMLDSAVFLGLLYREGEPDEEFIFHLSAACLDYREYAADLRARGIPFHPPTEGPAARLCKLGEEGDGWFREALEGASEPGCFPVASAELLEKACYAWLYDAWPHVMAVLDERSVMHDGVSHNLWREDEILPCGSAMWRWRVEQCPTREDVYRSGVLRPAERGIPRRMFVTTPMWEMLDPRRPPPEWDLRKKQRARGTVCDECLHLFGPNQSDKPVWFSERECEACNAMPMNTGRDRSD